MFTDARHNFLGRWGVPTGWISLQLGDLAQVVGGGTPRREEGRYWAGGTIPWATPTDITSAHSKYIGETAEYITKAGLDSSAAKVLPARSILFTSRATIGAKAISLVPLATNQGFASLLPHGDDSEYLYYLLEVLAPTIRRLGSGTTFHEVSKRDLRQMWCAVPTDPAERKAIAGFLEAADGHIADWREAVARARELRRALMQELLPPWIGFRRLTDRQLPPDIDRVEVASRLADVSNGSTPSRGEGRYWRAGTIPWLATGKVHDRVISSASEFVTAAAVRECSIKPLPAGTVLIGMIGQGRTRGMAAYLDIEACINQNFGAFVPRSAIVGRWLFYYFDYHYSRLRELGGGTNQGALSCHLLKRLRLPVPAKERQREVAGVLEAAENLERVHQSGLQLAENLKTGLVRDLVTGKSRVPICDRQLDGNR